jgi:hypothetical protein
MIISPSIYRTLALISSSNISRLADLKAEFFPDINYPPIPPQITSMTLNMSLNGRRIVSVDTGTVEITLAASGGRTTFTISLHKNQTPWTQSVSEIY